MLRNNLEWLNYFTILALTSINKQQHRHYHFSSDENDIMITPHRRNLLHITQYRRRLPPPKSQSSTKGRAYDQLLGRRPFGSSFIWPCSFYITHDAVIKPCQREQTRLAAYNSHWIMVGCTSIKSVWRVYVHWTDLCMPAIEEYFLWFLFWSYCLAILFEFALPWFLWSIRRCLVCLSFQINICWVDVLEELLLHYMDPGSGTSVFIWGMESICKWCVAVCCIPAIASLWTFLRELAGVHWLACSIWKKRAILNGGCHICTTWALFSHKLCPT